MNECMNNNDEGAMFFLVSNVWRPFCPLSTSPGRERRRGIENGRDQQSVYYTPDMYTMHYAQQSVTYSSCTYIYICFPR